ncbi:hypothetical protein D1818_18110 [Aquimarina sp. BL5]|uniref:hypothetical protein n=1 Tax=Aquimarina sp. BL5 TaxID=1714860 RepID=UPI000E534686|nr:hypothetical protein [Aquimarina sp. BL5]AXT52655.1 hypothetical protein D1818_18110 [Aquimarina sp. BL5]RKN11719.1 hypothetical protein D7036_00810 [Aquimarina sp. BL5]
MSIKTKEELKSYFETGDIPTEQQYEQLIDGFYHKSEGEIVKKVLDNADDPVIIEFTDGTSVDIPKFWDIDQVNGLLEALAEKVTVETNKGLSSNDFTNAEKEKLASLSLSGGGSVTVDNVLSATSVNPVRNNAITAALNNKVSNSEGDYKALKNSVLKHDVRTYANVKIDEITFDKDFIEVDKLQDPDGTVIGSFFFVKNIYSSSTGAFAYFKNKGKIKVRANKYPLSFIVDTTKETFVHSNYIGYRMISFSGPVTNKLLEDVSLKFELIQVDTMNDEVESIKNRVIENIDVVNGYLQLSTDANSRKIVAQVSLKTLKAALDKVI